MHVPVEMPRERLDERAALIARHWEAAGEALRATRWSARAAEYAGVRNPSDAIRHWRKVRSMSGALPSTPETVALGVASRIWILELGWRLGISEVEAGEVFAEGTALAAPGQNTAALAMLHLAYATVREASGHLAEAVELAVEASRLADLSGDLEARLGSRGILVYAQLMSGGIREALAAAEDGIELTGGDASLAISVDIASALAFFVQIHGVCLGFLGRLQESAREIDRGIDIAVERGDLEVEGWARSWRVWAHEMVGDQGRARQQSGRAVEIAERSGSGFSLLMAYGAQGRACLLGGDDAAAATALERAAAVCRERSTALEWEPAVLSCLARAYLSTGETARALESASEAAARALDRRSKLWEPAALMALARGLRATGREHEANEALERALRVVRETGARAYEPFVELELAELARAAGRPCARERRLRRALALFREFGATGHARRLAAELGYPGTSSSAGSANKGA